MKILFLTQFFWPESRTVPTNLGALAEDLSKKGHEIIVVTGFPNHPLGKIYDGYRMRLWQWEEARGFKILRLPIYPDHSDQPYRRLLNYGSFLFSSTLIGSFLTRSFNADVVFAYYAPLTMGLIVSVYKMIQKAPVIYWVTDMWPENIKASGVNFSQRINNVLHQFEAWGYRQAKKICVDSPGFKENLVEKGVPKSKIQIITEWADESLFYPVERDEILGEEHGLTKKFNIIYGGNLGIVQHLSTVIEAAILLQDLTNVQFVFIGDGTETDNLKSQVAEMGLSNVKFIPRQPMDKMRYFFAWADALLIHLRDSPIYRLQLPSKVLAYLACGRPVLCAVPGAVEQIVREAGAGVFCPSEDPEAMAKQIRLLQQMTVDNLEEMGKQGRQAFLENYNRGVQVEKLEKVLTGALKI